MTTPEILTDQIWIHHSKQRLPRKTLDAWEQHRNQNCTDTLPTLNDFKLFLDSRAKARREFENQSSLVRHVGGHKIKQESRSRGDTSQSRFKPYDKATKRQTTLRASNDRFGFLLPTNCIMPGCNQVHYLGQCRHFATLSMDDKLQKVQEKQLCKCCLASGHAAAKCERTGCSRCPNERVKHHFRLCPKAGEMKPSTMSDNKPNPQ